MSTCYRFKEPVPFRKIKRLRAKGIKVVPSEDGDPDHVLLYDGTNYLHAYTGDGTDTGLTRYGDNDPSFILEQLTERFGGILSEHDDDFFDGEPELPADSPPGTYVSNKPDARGAITVRFHYPKERKKQTRKPKKK